MLTLTEQLALWRHPIAMTATGCPECGAGEAPRLGPCGPCQSARRRRLAGAGPVVPPALTRRTLRPLAPRSTAFLQWHSGAGVTETGAAFTAPVPRAPVATIVEMAAAAGVARVFLTGERPHAGDNAAFHRWAHEAPEGWETSGHYLERPDAPVLRFTDPDVGQAVELVRTASWWGSEPSPTLNRAAWVGLADALAGRWAGAVLLSSPATTGRELIARSIVHGAEWPTLPDELATLVRSTSGQGRIEFLAPPAATVPAFVEVDGRTMYGALCRQLPGGVPQWGAGEHQYGPFARCRVLAHWQVPRDWSHIGLLPARDADGGWSYPSTPGERAQGWLDGAELALARKWGWQVTVSEHVVWPPYKGAGPLDSWASRLLDLIDRHRRSASPADQLVARALRHVLIDALGALVGRDHIVSRSRPLEYGGAVELPAGAIAPRVEGDVIVWGERRPPAWPAMVHPEWSAAVWARCRVRMLDGPPVRGVRTGALHVPPERLLAIRTDALYLTDDPGWPDDGAAGRLRVKGRRSGPLPAPSTVAELLALRGGGA